MMRLFMVAGLVLVLPAISGASVIGEKRVDCEEINAEFNTCSIQAYEDYKKAFEAGDDGWPDWMARNSCNYMTAAVEECGNKLIGDCNTQEDVTNMQAEQRLVIIGQLKTSIEEWGSEKCPLVQSYIKRIKRQVEEGGEEGSVAVDGEEAEGEDGADAVDKDAGDETESEGGVDAEKEEDAGDVAEGEGGEDTETKEGEDLGGDTEAEGKDGVDAGDDALDKDAGDETENEGGVDAEKEEDAGNVVDEEGGEDTETEDLGGDTEVDIAGGDDDDAGEDEEVDGDKVEEEEDKKDKEDKEESSAASISASLSLLVAFYLAL